MDSPPKSDQRDRAQRHFVVELLAVLVFLIGMIGGGCGLIWLLEAHGII